MLPLSFLALSSSACLQRQQLRHASLHTGARQHQQAVALGAGGAQSGGRGRGRCAEDSGRGMGRGVRMALQPPPHGHTGLDWAARPVHTGIPDPIAACAPLNGGALAPGLQSQRKIAAGCDPGNIVSLQDADCLRSVQEAASPTVRGHMVPKVPVVVRRAPAGRRPRDAGLFCCVPMPL